MTHTFRRDRPAAATACLTRLSEAGALADCRDALGLPRGRTAASGQSLPPGKLDGFLSANGIERLAVSLPFSDPAVAGLLESALVAGLLATIQRTLKIRLPGTPREQIERSLGQISGAAFSGPELPPGISADWSRLAQIAPAATALRQAGVDLFGKSADRDLRNWLSNPSTRELLEGVSEVPVRSATLDGLMNLSRVSAAMQNLPARPMNDSVPGRLKTPGTSSGSRDGLASVLPAMRSAGLPSARRVAAHNAHIGNLRMARELTGLDPLHPRTGARISEMLRNLESSGVCRMLESTPIGPKHREGLKRLSQFAACRQSIRETLKVDILERDAAGKLAPAVERLRVQAGAASAAAGRHPAELIAALSRLAGLGTALQSQASGNSRPQRCI